MRNSIKTGYIKCLKRTKQISLFAASSFCIFTFLLLFALLSCRDQETKLEKALRLSGDNRSELEKTLNYFSRNAADSLKLKSAVFLIENMPGHWGPDSNSIRAYKARIDTIPALTAEAIRVLLNLPSRYPQLCPELKKAEDIHTMKADYLIRHIEWACRLKDSCTWLADVGFDIFAEYILPYRLENEFIDFSKYTSNGQLPEIISYAIRNYNDCQYSTNAIANYIFRQDLPAFRRSIKDSLLRKLALTHKNQNDLLRLTLRQSGIPVATDYSPIHYTGDNITNWNIPIDPRLPQKYRTDGIFQGKVYRHTYSAHPIPETTGPEFIPPFFQNPFKEDVTDLYFYTTTIGLSLPPPLETHYAYLTMFDGNIWQPIAYSEIKDRKCLFTKLPPNSLYLPIYYSQENMQPLGSPLILRNNSRIDTLNGLKDSVINIRTERLCPNNYIGSYYCELREAQFECADNENFKNTDTVFTIKKSPFYKSDTIHPAQQLKKRYWRIKVAFKYFTLSELQFLNQDGKQLKGRYLIKDTNRIAVLTDNNPQTVRTFSEPISIDFCRPVQVASICYMQMNDGYNVWPGNEYELFYYQDKWVSAGIQKATEQSILFTGVPANRLYQLRNKTKNINGRAFTWEKEKIRFW